MEGSRRVMEGHGSTIVSIIAAVCAKTRTRLLANLRIAEIARPAIGGRGGAREHAIRGTKWRLAEIRRDRQTDQRVVCASHACT